MKSIIIKILLIALAITLVYVVGFSMAHSGSHEKCPVAAVAGGQCSFGTSGVSILDAANLHLNALKRISLGSLGYLWLAMLSVLLTVFAIAPKRVLEKIGNPSQVRRLWLKIKTSSLRKSLDWLITREKRDPASIYAVSA